MLILGTCSNANFESAEGEQICGLRALDTETVLSAVCSQSLFGCAGEESKTEGEAC